ncbi:YicC family protein [candidate division TA06 bacterium B3_TA06]|uniref:YicC family protein n=1 Tax=candidate division TA06 bacterium B3_TA06 TaxID=2012487 RepID=A0A532VAP0_UNCT6|nr:MAG: YicC family protein [candidate division TA06 bacterium B3_TA06]
MVNSMTGQGRAVAPIKPEGLRLTVEVHSLNHRYLEVSVKLPDQLAGYEEKIKQVIKENLNRGSVSVTVHLEESNGKRLVLAQEVLDDFLHLLKELRKRVPVSEEITPELLFRIPGLIKEESRDVETARLWKYTKRLVDRAIKDLVRMRRAEGRNLEKDLRGRLKVINSNLSAVKRRIPGRIKKKRAKLLELLEEMKIEPDRNRLLQEVLYFSERFDIHEECVRLENHIKLFRETLRAKESNGRRLNFITQEMMKETNTIGSKANDTAITHFVIAMKEEVEKIREQVQNVE